MIKLELGLRKETIINVTSDLLANEQGSGTVAVFSTPSMIANMERTSVLCVQPYLDAGYTTVGIKVDVTHEAPTPLGNTVKFISVLTDISSNNKIFTFDVEAYDDFGLIGKGIHKRAVIHKDHFEEKANKKRN